MALELRLISLLPKEEAVGPSGVSVTRRRVAGSTKGESTHRTSRCRDSAALKSLASAVAKGHLRRSASSRYEAS